MSGRTARRPLLLLPPSKGKAPGGHGPPYPRCLAAGDPLTQARRTVVDALTAAVPTLSDRDLARLAGVRAKDVPVARAELAELTSAPTLPAHRRYTGVVHGNAGLADVAPAGLDLDVRIVSGLAGLVALDELLPPYRVEFAASLTPLGGLATWWRDQLREHLRELTAGRVVWDLLPGEHARIWDREVRRDAHVVEVAFVRPDGRAANAARTKVCKGRLAAFLLAHPATDPAGLVDAADPGPGWQLTQDEDRVTATFTG